MTTRGKMLRALSCIAVAASLIQPACKTPGAGANSSVKEGFNDANNPLSRFGVPSVRFDRIATSGKLSTQPWPGYYWATYRGGIGYRWTQYLDYSSNALGNMSHSDFAYQPYGASQARALNESQIRGLSPAEKFDLLKDDYGFTTTNAQRNLVRSAVGTDGEIPTWFGICHAWAPAAFLTPYPGQQIKVANRAGQCVTLYRDDLKALASAAYDSNLGSQYSTMALGDRCNIPTDRIVRDSLGRISRSECRDTNPGAFHVVVTSLIANNKPAVLDVTYTDEVWNQPLYGYSFRYSNDRNLSGSDPLGSVRAPGTVRLVDVDFTLQYIVESSPSNRSEDINDYVSSATYYYTLELDNDGIIIGGEWRTQQMTNASIRLPDFVWAPSSAATTSGPVDLPTVDRLIKLSLSNTTDYCNGDDWRRTTPIDPRPNPPTPVPNPVDGNNGNNGNGGGNNGGDGQVPLPHLPPARQDQQQINPNVQQTQTSVSIQGPRAPQYSPYVNPKNVCPVHSTRFKCESDGRNGCIWFDGKNKCISLESNRCLDFSEENVCRSKGGDCEWTAAKKCESKEVLKKRKTATQSNQSL